MNIELLPTEIIIAITSLFLKIRMSKYMANQPYLQYTEGCVCGIESTGTETCRQDGLWKCGHCHKYVCKSCQHFDEFGCDSKPYGYDDGWWNE